MGVKHRDRSFVVNGARIRAAANADSTTECWRCGKTLLEHADHKTGRKPTWQAGHKPDGTLAAEASTCNTVDGAITGNQQREPHSGWI
jgi:hypothetical protein